MAPTNDLQSRSEELKKAFINDGYTERQTSFIYNGKIGMVAVSPATIGKSDKRKKAYYVEGSPFEMGYLMGQMAKNHIKRMAHEFRDNLVLAFLNQSKFDPIIKDILAFILNIYVNIEAPKVYADAPLEMQQEIQGMVKGVNPDHPDDLLLRLQVLNFGVDVLCALIYTLDLSFLEIFEKKAEIVYSKKIKLDPSFFQVPIACNDFSIFGEAAVDDQGHPGHYFGRDYQFPNAGVYQDVATLVIYNPDPNPDPKIQNLPLVSVTAPGFAGSIAAMNSNGVAAGVDILSAKNCDREKIGLNSLPMVRCAIQHGENAKEAKNFIVNSTTGVPWIYAISDGTDEQDCACIVEAGAVESQKGGPLRDIDEDLLALLPKKEDLPTRPDYGYKVRWSNDTDESGLIYEYIEKYNPGLAEHFKKPDLNVKPLGYIDHNNDHGKIEALEHNCPSEYYFAPPRWTGDPAYNKGYSLIATNHFLDPVMRLNAMSENLDMVVYPSMEVVDESQWRYDVLNKEICDALGVAKPDYQIKTPIDYSIAKKLIEFLAPYPNCPWYKYYPIPKGEGKTWEDIEIKGCTSIFDLKKKTVETHAGYYGDEWWLKITLPNYLPKK